MSTDPNKYMWIFLFFDLPTKTGKDRKHHQKFVALLKMLGFSMYQFSIYICCCRSNQTADTQIRKIEKILPPAGKVTLLRITDAQFEAMKHFRLAGTEEEKPKPLPLIDFQ